MRREDWAGACERWEAVRVAFPDHTSGYERGTVALMNAGRLEEAESLAEEAAVALPPTSRELPSTSGAGDAPG